MPCSRAIIRFYCAASDLDNDLAPRGSFLSFQIELSPSMYQEVSHTMNLPRIIDPGLALNTTGFLDIEYHGPRPEGAPTWDANQTQQPAGIFSSLMLPDFSLSEINSSHIAYNSLTDPHLIQGLHPFNTGYLLPPNQSTSSYRYARPLVYYRVYCVPQYYPYHPETVPSSGSTFGKMFLLSWNVALMR